MMTNLEKLFDRSLEAMGKTLNLRLGRQETIASNLANMDTPGYRVRELDFQKVLEKSMPPRDGELAVSQTHEKHIPARRLENAYAAAAKNIKYSVYGKDETGQDVLDLDQEMTKLVKNQLMYNATVQMLTKEYENIKYAISEGGK